MIADFFKNFSVD